MKVVLSQVLQSEELQKIHILLSKIKWQKGQYSAGSQAAQVKRNLQIDDGSPLVEEVQSLVLNGLNRHSLFYCTTLPRKILKPMLNRYDAQHPCYGKHIDNALRRLNPTASHYVRTDISCTVFLNSPTEYEGGELIFEDTFQKNVIKLSAGDAILYPANTVHEVTPVTQGYRHACVLWIQSFIKNSSQREMLYQLDSSLTKLKDRADNFQECLALTGLYHNLLREWTET